MRAVRLIKTFLSPSQEEKGLSNHLGEESRLRCTTHGEGGSQVHLSWRVDVDS